MALPFEKILTVLQSSGRVAVIQALDTDTSIVNCIDCTDFIRIDNQIRPSWKKRQLLKHFGSESQHGLSSHRVKAGWVIKPNAEASEYTIHKISPDIRSVLLKPSTSSPSESSTSETPVSKIFGRSILHDRF